MSPSNDYVSDRSINVDELAVSPNLPADVPTLLQRINDDGKEYLETTPQARLKLLETARSLVYALETPREALIRHCWSEVCFACSACVIVRNLVTLATKTQVS